MNRRIRKKINRRAESRLISYMNQPGNKEAVRGMSTLEVENVYRILTPKERTVFLKMQNSRIQLVNNILNEIQAEERAAAI